MFFSEFGHSHSFFFIPFLEISRFFFGNNNHEILLCNTSSVLRISDSDFSEKKLAGHF